MPIELHEADADDLDAVESLLAANGLPTDDVRDGSATFYLAERAGDVVGVGGLEVAGTAALLRSVAVVERRTGDGTAICAQLEARARDQGVRELYLLTETAAGFFERLGYERVDRDEAPAAIQRTAEFRDLCGDSAACLRKRC